jgi:putative ABC transport system substrate-binding protein
MKRRSFLAALIGGFAAFGARAQTLGGPARIGVVEYGAPPDSSFVRAYLTALQRLGYGEPATLQVERRYAQGNASRYGELVRDLAANHAALVFTVGNDIARVAKDEVPALPVVTAGSEDPVLSGLIQDYRRPGGNVTGVTYLSPQLAGKRLELLKEVVPRLARVSVLWDPAHFDTYYRDMEPDARALGIRLNLLEVRAADELEGAIAGARRARADALFVVPSRMLNLQARRVCDLALAAKLPMITPYVNFTEVGGLLSYGAVAADLLQRAAAQTVKILGGEKAGAVPFERAATFELVINLRTARALGLAVPRALLLRADRVID